MGQWSETDGITQLPINYRDKIVLVILRRYEIKQNKSFNHSAGMCYIDDVWSPIGYLYGKYDDYGCIDHIEKNAQYDLLLNDFRKNWSKDITMAKALECITREENVEYKYIGDTYLGVMFVLREVFDALANYNPIVNCLVGEDDNRLWQYVPKRDGLTVTINNWYKTLVEKHNAATSEHDRMTVLFRHMSISDRIFGHNCAYRDPYVDCLYKLATQNKSIDDPEVKEVSEALITLKSFESSMTASRKMWAPQCGKGSQDTDLSIYKFINKTSTNIINKRIRKDKAEWFDEDEVVDKNGYTPYMIKFNEEQLQKKKDEDGNKKDSK
jgi:hypothetical protein